jgi:hypothetical protein
MGEKHGVQRMRFGEPPEFLVHRGQWAPAGLVECRNLVPRRLHAMASAEFVGNQRLERVQHEGLEPLALFHRTERAGQFHQAGAFGFVESCHVGSRCFIGERHEGRFGSRKFAARRKKPFG